VVFYTWVMAAFGHANSAELKRRKGAPFYNPKNESIRNHYTISKTLGKGSFATTKLATSTADKSLWAAKVLSKRTMQADDIKAFQQEIKILKTLDHPNVCWTREIFEDRNNYFVVCELMTGGELFDRIVEKEYYTEKEAAVCVADICKALVYCHDRNIVHRDLKPENIMYANMKPDSPVKVVDFGLSTTAAHGDATMKTACGTPEYVAPEVISKKPYTNKCDMWSVGVIMYILLCGYPPFGEENSKILYRKIRAADIDFPPEDWQSISKDAYDLVNSLIVVDISKRLSAKQVLEHKWMVKMLGKVETTPSKASAAALPNLARARGNMKAFNARRKLRVAAMIARLKKLNSMGAVAAEPESSKAAAAPETTKEDGKKGCLIM